MVEAIITHVIFFAFGVITTLVMMNWVADTILKKIEEAKAREERAMEAYMQAHLFYKQAEETALEVLEFIKKNSGATPG